MAVQAFANPFLPIRAVLRNVVQMTEDNHLFQFTVENDALACGSPGQFVEVWVPGAGECPISLCSDRTDGTLELTVRRVGRVTDALFKLVPGQWVGVRGPYGRGFPVDALAGGNLVLVAGGLGIAPIRGLVEYILNHRERFGEVVLVYGMRHSVDLLFRHEVQNLICRDDMHIWIGAEEINSPEVQPIHTQLGRVTDMLRAAAFDRSYSAAVCGPPVAYPYIVNELKAKGVVDENIYLSLERHMKCGLGKCGHCFIGGTFACQKGPVFALSELRFIPEVIECAGC